MKYQRVIAAEFVISTALINVLALATPFFVIHVLNRYIAFGVDTTLATLTVGALIAIGLEFGFREARIRLASVFSNAFVDRFEQKMFDGFLGARAGALE